ncbi:hypothetical protein ACAN107058_19410 [Paracidovorax anthurii]
MSTPCRAAYTLIGQPARKMMSPVATMAQKALAQPYCTSSVAPTASSTRNEAAPNAVLATRNGDQRRKRRGV